jgi:tetratricopeptide (TPR) repeat protein
MTVPGDIVLRRSKDRRATGTRPGWLLILFLLTAGGVDRSAQSAMNPSDLAANALSSSNFPDINPAPGNTNTINIAGMDSPASATNADSVLPTTSDAVTGTNGLNAKLAMAHFFERTQQPQKAEMILLELLATNYPAAIQKSALIELGTVAQDENDLPRAQSIYSQFLDRWPGDVMIPEVLLRQGKIFRQIGLTDLALGKFYSVMASALSLKNDQFAYYQRLVLQTQVEIAETHYLMGHYVDAAEFYSRLLQNPDPALNRPQMQFRLIRSLTIIHRYDEAVGQAQDFLSRYADADEAPEVRYYLAQSLKALGRNAEALQQVLLCLQEQKIKTKNDPAVWAYWQQRVGNEIANQLYREGDYVKALEIYVNLAQLDSSPDWQVPVYYQMGITYEKLLQPQKAIETYNKILAQEAKVGTNATPGLQAVFDMAQWRIGFLKWQNKAQTVDQALATLTAAETGATNSPTKTSP